MKNYLQRVITSIIVVTLSQHKSHLVNAAQCLNDFDYVSNVLGNPDADCQWIGWRENRRNNYCVYEEVHQYCPQICGDCCEDDRTYKYKVPGVGEKHCWYLTTLDAVARENKCNEWRNKKNIRAGCPKTCDQCRTLIEAQVPTALPTDAPSESPTTSPSTESPSTSSAPSESPTTAAPSESPSTSAPTKNPTDYPTATPTTSPPTVSNHPIGSPTESPTDYPTVTPTTSPPTTPLPTPLCQDNQKFLKNSFPYYDKFPFCMWLRKKGERRSRRCREANISENCPFTCGQCCQDDPSYTFKNDQPVTVDCAWIDEKKNKRKYWCDKKISGKFVRDACPVTCDFCFSKVVVGPGYS